MRRLTTTFLGVTLALGMGSSLSAPTQAAAPTGGDRSFVCQQDATGTYKTIARTRTAEFPVFVWKSDFFTQAGWPPERRCQAVSSRLQRLAQAGQMKFLMADYLHGEPVVCAAQRRETATCSNESLIFTLQYRPGSSQSLKDYAEERITALRPLTHSSNIKPLFETRPRSGEQGNDVLLFNFVGYLDQLEEDVAPSVGTSFFGN